MSMGIVCMVFWAYIVLSVPVSFATLRPHRLRGAVRRARSVERPVGPHHTGAGAVRGAPGHARSTYNGAAGGSHAR